MPCRRASCGEGAAHVGGRHLVHLHRLRLRYLPDAEGPALGVFRAAGVGGTNADPSEPAGGRSRSRRRNILKFARDARQAKPAPAPGIRPPMPPGGKAFEARREADLALLLDLKPAQKPALADWLEAPRPGPRGFHPDDPPPATPPTFGERLDAMVKVQTEASTQGRAWIAAATFSAQLDPHQRQLFDALERLRCGQWGIMADRAVARPRCVTANSPSGSREGGCIGVGAPSFSLVPWRRGQAAAIGPCHDRGRVRDRRGPATAVRRGSARRCHSCRVPRSAASPLSRTRRG